MQFWMNVHNRVCKLIGDDPGFIKTYEFTDSGTICRSSSDAIVTDIIAEMHFILA